MDGALEPARLLDDERRELAGEQGVKTFGVIQVQLV